MSAKVITTEQWNLPGDIACSTLSRNTPEKIYYK